jgi:hypothetical protein
VGFAVAPQALQQDRVFHSSEDITRIFEVSADLIDPFKNTVPLAGKFEHFRHEREEVQSPIRVKRAQDFVRAADFDKISDTKAQKVNRNFIAGQHLLLSKYLRRVGSFFCVATKANHAADSDRKKQQSTAGE